MISTSAQYHGLVNLLKAAENGDLSERTILVCAFAYKLKKISEVNLITILNGCAISLQRKQPHTIIHFFYYSKMIEIIDNDLGLVKILAKMEPKPYYTDENIKFARKELERIGRAKIE